MRNVNSLTQDMNTNCWVDFIRQYLLHREHLCYILTFWPSQKCHSKVMHRKEVTHSNGSYERKSRGRKLADEMGRAKKFPWYTHRLMHQKRVTSELHDSYFRLMIKHSISKIEWASNDYITQLSSTSQVVASRVAGQLEMRCGRESHTRPKGLGALMSWDPEKMLIRCRKESHHPAEWSLDLRSRIKEQERHNVTAISLGSKYFSYVRSPTPSHMQTLNYPFEPLQ